MKTAKYKSTGCIKVGKGTEFWQDQPHKKRQKDVDARWTQKGGEKFFGYKDHAKIDTKSKLIDTYDATSAEVHDSQQTEKLVSDEDGNQDFHADSAYTCTPYEVRVSASLLGRFYRKKK